MLSRITALVLGAGSSIACGYPLGGELRGLLIGLPAREEFCSRIGLDGHELAEFVNTFRRSQLASIDAFLARRPEFERIGKLAIAALLLECENVQKLEELGLPRNAPDPWYRYLFNELIAVHTWEELDFSKLVIVTFNYDRSLEHFLLFAMQNAYGKSIQDVATKLMQLGIVHVYGTIGPTLPGLTGYTNYGQEIDQARVTTAASTIKVIPEGRESDPTLVASRKLLLDADRIVFLGFGFDRTNLARLDSKKTCRAELERDGTTTRHREIAGTCIGMTESELQVARERTCGQAPPIFVPPVFQHGINCITLLRSLRWTDGDD